MPSHTKNTALLIDHYPGSASICGSGMGSSLFKLAAATEAKNSGWQLDLMTSPEKLILLKGTPTFRCISDTLATIDYEAYSKIVILGITSPNNLLPAANTKFETASFDSPAKEKQFYNTLPHLMYWRIRLNSALNVPIKNTTATYPLYLLQEEKDWAQNRLRMKKKWIGIAVQALSNLKQYHQWLNITKILNARYPELGIVWLGNHTNNQPHLQHQNPSLLDLCGQTTVRQLMAIVNQCDVILGSDGLITNLGLAFNRPTVALFSIIDPVFISNTTIHGTPPFIPLLNEGCPMQFCYPHLKNYRNDPCPFEPNITDETAVTCMRFTPEKIITTVSNVLKA